jgi:hypothetical protein
LNGTNKILNPAHAGGLFFCLASAEGAGLSFCLDAIQPKTSVYSAFCRVNAIIPPTQQNNAQGFTVAFPAIRRVLSLLFGCLSGYTAQPAQRWSVSQRRSTSNAYQIPDATPDAVQLNADRLL